MTRRKFIRRGGLLVPATFGFPAIVRGAFPLGRQEQFKPPFGFTAPGGGAITKVQDSGTTFADSASSISATLNGVTAGNLLVFVVCSAEATPFGVLATPTNYTVAEAPSDQAIGGSFHPVVGIFFRPQVGSGTHSPSCTLPTGSFAMCNLSEWSITVASPLDKHTNNGTATGVTAGDTGTTAATSDAAELVIVCIDPENNSNTSALSTPPSSGYTSLAYSADDSVHVCASIGFKILAATGTQQGSWTWTNASGYSAAIATFKNS